MNKSNDYRLPRSRNARKPAIHTCTLLALTLLLLGCTVRLIGDYDDTIDKGVTDIQQKTVSYIATIQSDGTKPYDQTFYQDINSRVVVLQSRASLLPKYPIIQQQLSLLKDSFSKMQELDQISKRPVNAAVFKDAQDGIDRSIESILKLELALRDRGKVTAPSLTGSH